MRTKENSSARWLYLLIGSLVFLFAGLIYSWPVFAPVFGAEFKSWDSAALGLTFTFSMSFFCIGNIAGGPIVKKTSPRIAMIITAAMIFLGFAATTLVRENAIFVLYSAYGILCGFGVGVVYNVVLTILTAWFPDKVGTISGILMMTFAVSTLLLGTGASALMELYGWRAIFMALGILTALVILFGSLFMKAPGKNTDLPEKAAKHHGLPQEDVPVSEMLISKPFWIFMFWGLFILVCVYSLMGNAKQVALDIGASSSLATLSVSVISLSNGVGRLVLGSAYDKFGRQKTMTLNSVFMLVSSVLIITAFKSGSMPFMLAGFMLAGLGYGGVPPTSSAFVVDFFGSKGYSVKFGFISLYILFGSVGSYMAGLMKTKTGTFQTAFYVLIVLEIIAIVLNFFIKKTRASKVGSVAANKLAPKNI